MGLLGKSGLTAREAALSIAVQTGEPVFYAGPPGVGKTMGFLALGRAVGRHVEPVIISVLDPTDLHGLPYIHKDEDGETEVRFATPGFGKRIIKLARQGIASILFLDEITQGAESVQNAAMRLVHDREVGEEHLPASCWIVAAGNPTDTSGGTRDLTAALANRFRHFQVENDDAAKRRRAERAEKQAWADLSEVVLRPDWSREENVSYYRGLVQRFRQETPREAYNEPADGDAKAGGPWPSDRSWESAERFMAAANYSLIDGQPVPLDVYHEGIAACVGQAAMTAFWAWVQANTGLSGADLLQNPAKILGVNDADLRRAASQAIDLVCGKPNQIAWNSIWAVFRTLADHGAAEIGAELARELLKDPRVKDSRGGWKFALPTDASIQPVIQGLRSMGVIA